MISPQEHHGGHNQAEEDHQHGGPFISFLNPFYVSGAQVLSGEGGQGGSQGIERLLHQLLNTAGSGEGRDDVGSEAVDHALERDAGKGDEASLRAEGNPQAEHFRLQAVADPEIFFFQAEVWIFHNRVADAS